MISIVSLSGHHLDEAICDYIYTMFLSYGEYKVSRNINRDTSMLIITNGVYKNANQQVLQKMKEVPSFYLIDDHECWVPDATAYPNCTILSQFVEHPVVDVKTTYLRISEFLVFDKQFDVLPATMIKPRRFEYVYWGRYKEEREEQYGIYFNKNTLLVGKNYPAYLVDSVGKYEPFTKDLDDLYSTISEGKYTYIFGDEFHNGINFPWRIYEAIMLGITPLIDEALIGDQDYSTIEYFIHLLGDGINKNEYLKKLKQDRDRIYMNFTKLITPKNKPGAVHVDFNANAIQESRAKSYGSYAVGVDVRADIMNALNTKYRDTHDEDMPSWLTVVFSDIVLKLMRAASEPTHIDSWADLEVYSKLIKEAMIDGKFNS